MKLCWCTCVCLDLIRQQPWTWLIKTKRSANQPGMHTNSLLLHNLSVVNSVLPQQHFVWQGRQHPTRGSFLLHHSMATIKLYNGLIPLMQPPLTHRHHGYLSHPFLNPSDHLVMASVPERSCAGAHFTVFDFTRIIIHHARLSHTGLGLHVSRVNDNVMSMYCSLICTLYYQ